MDLWNYLVRYYWHYRVLVAVETVHTAVHVAVRCCIQSGQSIESQSLCMCHIVYLLSWLNSQLEHAVCCSLSLIIETGYGTGLFRLYWLFTCGNKWTLRNCLQMGLPLFFFRHSLSILFDIGQACAWEQFLRSEVHSSVQGLKAAPALSYMT